MDNKLLNFYEINAEYISHLSRFDSRVPRVDYSETGEHNKFLCGIVLSVNNYNYFAPISSFTTPQRTNIIINNENDEAISSIRFSFMIPVPKSMVIFKDFKNEPSPEYRRLLNLELQFCRNNANSIFRLSKHVYKTVTENKDPIMVKNCCNFKNLESAMIQYCIEKGISEYSAEHLQHKENTYPKKQSFAQKQLQENNIHSR